MTDRNGHIFDWSRRLLAGLLLLTSVYLTWGRTVCGDELASTGDQGVVRACRSLAITDPPVLGGLLLILLLLLPDLSEIGIPGFLSLKRRVQEQETKLEEQEGRLAALNAQIEQAIDLQQTATQDVDTRASAMSVNVLDIAGVLQRFETKTRLELAETPSGEDSLESAIPAARAQLESRLLRVWAQFESQVNDDSRALTAIARDTLADARANLLAATEQLGYNESRFAMLEEAAHGDPKVVDKQVQRDFANAKHVLHVARANYDQSRKALVAVENAPSSTWNRDFRQEIEIVKAARNALIHSEPIEDNKLSAAVRLAEGLLEAWRGRSSRASDATNKAQATEGSI